MAEKILNESEAIDAIVTTPYKYGFTTNIGVEDFEKGLNSQVIQKISEKKNEPDFLLKFRQKAFSNWQKMSSPIWAYIETPTINYNDIQYYSVPRTKKKLTTITIVTLKL